MRMKETQHRNNLRSKYSLCSVLNAFKLGSNISALVLWYTFLVVGLSQGKANANSLEEVDDKELQKLINQEQYVAVLFSKFVYPVT